MITITNQPAAQILMAAYRPIVSKIKVDNLAPSQPPKVVYCDVYIKGVFYKTFSKTQSLNIAVNNSFFEFDIQDALQEYIQKYLYSNGLPFVEQDILHEVYCRYRSSTIDANGFLIPDPVVPIQATGSTPSVAGTGTQGNTFFVVNATLQHEDNQDLETHLNTFKNYTWAANVFPLSHRPDKYKICNNDSDYFPLVNKGNTIKCIRLNYRLKNSPVLTTVASCGCVNVAYVPGHPFAMPDPVIGDPYTYDFEVTGTAPFFLANVVKPDWMDINIVGNVIEFTGTPQIGDEGENIQVSLQVKNCVNGSINFNQTLNIITMPPGLIAMWSGLIANIPAGWLLCDGTNGTPNLSGQFVVGVKPGDTDFNAIGDTGGVKQVTLSVAQMPSHSHGYIGVDTVSTAGGSSSNRRCGDFAKVSDPQGGDQPHENLPPFYVLAYIMKQ